ncbi:MAG: hypothetical protein JXB45_11670 [Candidatus Krumholzibacteriota bacterium]|nr:hypothetical protein [Candidatus Krumholzibacteriota bacterium]
MKENFMKQFFIILVVTLLGGWFICGPFCPFCVEKHIDEGSCDQSCETRGSQGHSDLHSECVSHHQDVCHHCGREQVSNHFHQRLVFSLPGKSRTGECPLIVTALTAKSAAYFQLMEIEPYFAPAGGSNLSLESLRCVIMLA